MSDPHRPDAISREVRAFVRTYVDSVGLLEILLLLHETPNRAWTPDDVTTHLTSSLSSVRTRLDRLQARGLVSSSKEKDIAFYRYAPSSPEVAAAVDGLALAYRGYRLRVVDLVYGESSQLSDFSDSFRIRKEKEKP